MNSVFRCFGSISAEKGLYRYVLYCSVIASHFTIYIIIKYRFCDYKDSMYHRKYMFIPALTHSHAYKYV